MSIPSSPEQAASAFSGLAHAWIGGHRTVLEDAIVAIGARLAQARAPVIAGLGSDVETVRAACRLALAAGASLDGADLAGLYAELSVVSTTGTLTTTPAEARARADLVLLVGRAAGHPIVDFMCAGPPPRQPEGTTRQILALDAEEGGQQALPGAAGLLRAISLLRASLAGRPAARADYAPMAQALQAATFGVILYDPAELGEMGVDLIQGLARDLNATTRFSTCALIDPEARLAVAVGTWTLGQAPRNGLGRGFPEHDPWRFNAERLVRSGEADALMWLHPAVPPPDWAQTVPVAAFLCDPKGSEADIVVAVATPGRETSSVVWDTQRATMTHCPASAPSPACPTAAHILDALRNRATLARRH